MKLEELQTTQISQETLDRWEEEGKLVESCDAKQHIAELKMLFEGQEYDDERFETL